MVSEPIHPPVAVDEWAPSNILGRLVVVLICMKAATAFEPGAYPTRGKDPEKDDPKSESA